jgi:hypothetical protein
MELNRYDMGQAMLPARSDLDAIDFVVHQDPERRAAIAAACELEPTTLSADQVGALLEFLHALIDPGCVDLRREVPKAVPSKLPVYE